MDEILTNLQTLLQNDLSEQFPVFQQVVILDDAEQERYFLKANFPACILSPQGESNTPSELGDTATREFRVRVRLVDRSSQLTTYYDPTRPDTIYKISDAIRTSVASQKDIGFHKSKWGAYEVDVSQPITEMIGVEDGVQGMAKEMNMYKCRDIIVTYRRFEAWIGRANNQTTLVIQDAWQPA